jgi:hypothetical protein
MEQNWQLISKNSLKNYLTLKNQRSKLIIDPERPEKVFSKAGFERRLNLPVHESPSQTVRAE